MRIYNATLAGADIATIEINKEKIGKLISQSGRHIRPPAGARRVGVLAEGGPGDEIDAEGALVVPAAIDGHIHSRDPGLLHKEDWGSIGACARQGGVAAVVDMPNTVPPTLFADDVARKAERARQAGCDFRILLGVSARNIATIGETLLRDDLPLAGVKVFYGPTTGDLVFSDLAALAKAITSRGRRLVVFHSEDQCGIACNQEKAAGRLAVLRRASGPETYAIHSELRSSATAWASTATILEWAVRWGGPVHIAHVSTPREVEMIQAARQRGATITCEIAPHHILFSTADYPRLGGFLKVNPPVRSTEEVEALRRHLAAGAIDAIATDHAPHTREEKSRPYSECPAGMPALDFFYPLALEMAKVCGLSRQRLVELVAANPARIFGFENLGAIAPGKDASFVALSGTPLAVSAKEVVSKCGWSPYDGRVLPGAVQAMWYKGRCVFVSKTN